MKVLSRRRWLLGGVAAVGVAAAGVGYQTVLRPSAEERIKAFLRTRLDYLQLSDEVLDAFIRDYKKDTFFGGYLEFARRSYGIRSAANRMRVTNGWRSAQRFERSVIAQFLLSTDFFREGADVNRPVSYWRYCDPYKVGCANEFAKLS